MLGVGIQLFTMTFLIGVGKSFLDQYYKAFEVGTPDLNSLCVLLVASVILLTLVNKLPPMLAGIVGSGGQASGIGSFGAGAALGAATMAASAVASAGSAALAGANELAGGASALSAAFKSAQADMEGTSNDTGTVMSDSASDQQISGGQGQSAFGQAMGSGTGQESGYASRLATAGRVATNAASVVADHVGQTISSHASAAIGATTGGKLATAIDESSKKSQAGNNPVFEGNSLSMHSDEISDFVNKNPTQD